MFSSCIVCSVGLGRDGGKGFFVGNGSCFGRGGSMNAYSELSSAASSSLDGVSEDSDVGDEG